MAINEETFIRDGYGIFYDWARSDVMDLFKNLLSSTQAMCYLTFKEKDKSELIHHLMDMNSNGLIKLLSDMCDFCDENNIK